MQSRELCAALLLDLKKNKNKSSLAVRQFSVKASKWQQQQQSWAPYQHSPPWSALADTITAYVATNPATSATPGPEGLEMSNTFKLL